MAVALGVRVMVGVFVAVRVGVEVGVSVATAVLVGVFVAVLVAVSVAVAVAVWVAVPVSVAVAMFVAVPVSVAVAMFVAALVAVLVAGRGVLVGVFVGVLVAGSVTIATLFTSSILGYIFAKFEFPGKSIAFMLILATMMIPFPLLLVPLYLVVDRLELLKSLWALIIPSLVSAFGVFLMRLFISTVPNDLIDAARLGGASEFGIYRTIILPLVRAPLAALGIFSFLGAWNDYVWPLIVINDTEKATLPLSLAFFNTSHAVRYDLTMAAATMAVLPVLIVFIVFQKQITSAFVMTGMK